MYGDSGAIRRLADQLRDQARDIRCQADVLVGRAEGVDWQGLAADAVRRRARERAAGLRRTAAAHDAAADALDRHATEVEQLQELIAAIERRARHLVSGARGRLADLGRRLAAGVPDLVPDPIDELLARFEPPPSGDRAWLEVDLPGIPARWLGR